MGAFKLDRPDRFPAGTEVAVYPVSNWLNSRVDEGAAPEGKGATKKKVGKGSLSFTGLKDGEQYVAYAKVGDQHRYVSFIPGATDTKPAKSKPKKK